MYNNNLPSSPVLPTDIRKYSLLGIISLVISVLAALGLCLTIGLSMYGSGSSLAYQAHQTLLEVVGFAAICSGGFGLLGLGLGIGAVFQTAKSKIFSIIGLVLGAVVTLALCGIMVLGMIIQSSS